MSISLEKNRLVAFVSNSAWSMYNFRFDVIRHLMHRGYQILVLAPEDEYSSYLTNLGCRFVPIEFNNKTENPVFDYFLYRRLKKLYASHRPDFIFHYVAKPNIYGSMAAAALNIPSVAVITGLGYPFAKRNWLYWVVKHLYKQALKKSTQVWFLNNEDAKVFVNEKITGIERTKVLPGEGINTAFFSPEFAERKKPGRNFTFLMSTRLLKSKGIGLYADAARILKKKNYDAEFALIGFFEKNHPDSISQEDLNRWEKEGLISYRGFAKDVRPFLQSADCLVFPSYYNEGIPRCLMEASSMEIPVITSMNRGCKEVVVNNFTGYLCNVNDPFDLADKMEKMLGLSNEERNRMGKNGRSLVMKKFSVSKVIEEYEDTLNQDLPD